MKRELRKIKTEYATPRKTEIKEEIKEILYKDEKVLPFIEGKEIKKIIDFKELRYEA